MLALWCPDWPAIAAAWQAGRPAADPVAVVQSGRIRACTLSARMEGVRVGMRRRQAQSCCPELAILPDDRDGSARYFEPVAAAVEQVAPGIEVLRPGLLCCLAKGPSSAYGGEEAAAEQLIDITESLDVECAIGIADVLATAVIAARQQAIVPPGADAAFLAALPIGEIAVEPALAGPKRKELADLLIRLGICTLGAFAQLPARQVAERFGSDGLAAHQLACGTAAKTISARGIPKDLLVEAECDPPLERVDAAAFLGRQLATQLHAKLAAAQLVCLRLAIYAQTESGAELSRIWHCVRPLTADATADRVRWQLDGWLTRSQTQPGPITLLRLEVAEALEAGLVQHGLWGDGNKSDQQAAWAFARLQGLLGPDAVLTPQLSGGRLPAERVIFTSWGERPPVPRPVAAPWPGHIPAPSPTILGADEQVRITAASGEPVHLSARGWLNADPVRAELDGVVSEIATWAGPWRYDQRWWEADTPTAYLQLVTADARAYLVAYAPATGEWQLKGVYD